MELRPCVRSFVEHDLFRPAYARRSIALHNAVVSGLRAGGKPVSTFRDHAPSHPLDEGVDDALLAGLVKLDGELVAVDMRHIAVAELLVKYPITQREG